MPEESYEDVGAETPLERAGRIEGARARAEESGAAQTRRAEHEADVVVGDVDQYVAQTDPERLPEAEAELDSWEIPASPLEGVPVDPPATGAVGDPLVPVFAAGSEMEASIVRGLIESAGIPTTLDSLPAPMFGSALATGEDRWGDILVPAARADEARAVIAAAQQSDEGGTTEGSSIV